MTTIDWSSLKKTADDATRPIPIGDYLVQVDKAEATQASTGAQMIKIQAHVVGGEANGRTVFNNFVLSPDKAFALAMFFRGMAAFGFGDDFFSQQPSMEQIAAAMVGRYATVTLSIRQWQGQDRNQCDAWSQPPAGYENPDVSVVDVMVATAYAATASPGVPSEVSSSGVPNVTVPSPTTGAVNDGPPLPF